MRLPRGSLCLLYWLYWYSKPAGVLSAQRFDALVHVRRDFLADLYADRELVRKLLALQVPQD